MPEHIRQEPKVLVSTENLTEQEWLASAVPEPFGHNHSPFQTEPDFRRMVSPGKKVVAVTLSRLFQGVSGEVPELESSPIVEST